MRLPFSKHKIALALVDVVTILLGFLFAFWYVFASGLYYPPKPFPRYFLPSCAVVTAIFLVTFHLQGLYKYQVLTDGVRHVRVLLKCYMQVLAVFVLAVFFMKTEYIADSRLTIGVGFLASFTAISVFRAGLLPRIFYLFVSNGLIRKRSLIVGAGTQGQDVCRYLLHNGRSYFEIVGFCDDDAGKTALTVCGRKVLGTSHEITALVREYAIREVIIAVSNIDRGTLLDLVDRCKKARVVVHVISELFLTVCEKLEAEEFGGLITYRVVPEQGGAVQRALKRMLDLSASACLVVLLAPLGAAIAMAIKRDSPGPVFYKSDVVGKDGATFTAYKFRSMVHGGTEADREEYERGKRRHLEFMKDFIQGRTGERYYVAEENRITAVGRVLRKYSLDELPQLLNVLKGQMSLVGPRFCSTTEYAFYRPWHGRRFEVKPGLTGLWQVRGRSAVSYDDMVMLDLYYAQNHSVLFDLEILMRTVGVVLRGKGSRIGEGRPTPSGPWSLHDLHRPLTGEGAGRADRISGQ